MPEPIHSSLPSTVNGSILLVEKYDVVATAIISALKQFAPAREFQVAARLPEAKKLAANAAPELFIIDFDPPEDGVVGFLTAMQTAHPTSRILVIAPGISREVAHKALAVGAIQFLEKPFDLSEFGEAVRRVLNLQTGMEKQANALSALHLIDLVHLICSAGSSSVIISQPDDLNSGEVHIRDGQICHALTGTLIGLDALQAMFTWRGARFREELRPAGSQRTIEGLWNKIVLEALHKAKVVEAQRAATPSPPAAPIAEKINLGKKILVIEDMETLLVFLEVVLREADPTWQITTARYGMEGLKQAQQIDPDLILLDYCLPDIKGDEVCRALLASEATAHIPVILMSSSLSAMTATASLFENAVATIAKPFVSEQITALVKKTLASGRVPATKTAVPKASMPQTPEPERARLPAQSEEKTPRGDGKNSRPSAWPSPFSSSRQTTPTPIDQPVTIPVQAPPPRPIAPVATALRNEALIGLPLEVTAIQLSSLLQIRTIRVKPLNSAASVQIFSSEVREVVPLKINLMLDTVALDADGRIAVARLVPTPGPPQQIAPQSTFEIGQITLGTHADDQILLSAEAVSMTVRLLVLFQFSAVEVSKKFEIAAIVLRGCRELATVTLDQPGNSKGECAISCSISAIQLDAFSRISQFSLMPRVHAEAAVTIAS